MLSIIANTCRTLADKMYPPADADFDDNGSNTSDFFQSHRAHFRVDEYFHGNNTPLSPDTIGQSNCFWEAASCPCADLHKLDRRITEKNRSEDSDNDGESIYQPDDSGDESEDAVSNEKTTPKTDFSCRHQLRLFVAPVPNEVAKSCSLKWIPDRTSMNGMTVVTVAFMQISISLHPPASTAAAQSYHISTGCIFAHFSRQ